MLSVIYEAIILKLNKSVNSALLELREADKGLQAKLARLDKKIICVNLDVFPLNLSTYIVFSDGVVNISSSKGDLYQGLKSDLVVNLTPGSIIRAGLTNIEHAIRERDIGFTGDLGIAMELQSILNNTDVNFTDVLQQKLVETTNDHFAWQFINILNKVLDRISSKQEQFNEQVADYLQIEKDIVVSKYELAEFIDEVDKIRDDFARLQARFNRKVTNNQVKVNA